MFEDVKVALATSNFVLESVCQQLADLRCSGGTVPSRIAVNVQPLQMIDDSFSQQIRVVTKKYGIEPCVFELELVETDDIAKILAIHEFTRALRRLGVRIALDDVGTGYTSLTILDRMHVDTIKIARELLTGVPDSPSACVVLSSMLDLSLNLGIESIVEGVETAEQMTWLVPRPDVYVQGYYIARPLSSLSDAVGGKFEWVSRMLA